MLTIEALHERFLQSTGACTDTRQLLAKGMFFALKGPNFNANVMATQALAEGCSYAVVDDPSIVNDDRMLLVPDVLKALQELARHHRRTFHIPVIGITGTNGKTTTKELMHAVLEADRPTLATAGNLNNHIGVPLTLLRLTAQHRIAIIEMGANHIGDIEELVGIAEPTHGIITNIGKAHLEGFGSYEGVITAKTELYDHLRKYQGTAFVHADDHLLLEKSAGMQRCFYGSAEECNTQGGSEEADDPFLHMYFSDHQQDDRVHVTLNLIGNYNAPNALCAACVGQYFGIPDATIVRALGNYSPSNNRSQFTDTGRNQLVLDAYNANPTSMRAALINFAAMRTTRPKLAILGGMKELGPDSRQEHEAIVALAKELGQEVLFIGPEFMELATREMRVKPDANASLSALKNDPLNGYLILLKGSRGTKLETLVPAL